ncbi:hypothetical protein ACFYN0_01340 [Streptomyces sp. NPDC006704]|uniref:hypothetical protein n=1 Tax=Streptomyces sp. NPDC006704 TaxID=3364760 RepID=UPI00369AF829
MHDPTSDTGLNSFAAILAGELPSNWTSTYHPHRGGSNDHDALTDEVWDMNEVADALAKHPVDHCAVLTRADGTRLFVTDALSHGEGYLIAAMAPQHAPAEAFRGVREPDGIAVADDPFRAAEDITHDLLPRYDKALAQVWHNAAAHLDAAPEPEHVTAFWSDRNLLVETPERADVVQVLRDNGFSFTPDYSALVLSGDDSAVQAQSLQAAGARLYELGVGVSVRHPQSKPAPDASPAASPFPASTPVVRSR